MTFSSAKMFLSHALCLKRHSEAFAAPEEARKSYDALLDTVFTVSSSSLLLCLIDYGDAAQELLQWLPHRGVTCERGECFYADNTHAKVRHTHAVYPCAQLVAGAGNHQGQGSHRQCSACYETSTDREPGLAAVRSSGSQLLRALDS